VVSILASGTQDCGFEPGSNPAEAVGFFGQKIRSMPSFGGEVKPSVPCCRFAACEKTPAIYMEVGTAAKIGWPFLAHNSILH
jgi:hypothetical protein